mmetsp:Transcript_30583/g.72369  ORF Transcript_30583/g.72369 Transcript_30583/m.72369 type:complete len:233 (-) Transcript_30583:197-895(-)
MSPDAELRNSPASAFEPSLGIAGIRSICSPTISGEARRAISRESWCSSWALACWESSWAGCSPCNRPGALGDRTDSRVSPASPSLSAALPCFSAAVAELTAALRATAFGMLWLRWALFATGRAFAAHETPLLPLLVLLIAWSKFIASESRPFVLMLMSAKGRCGRPGTNAEADMWYMPRTRETKKLVWRSAYMRGGAQDPVLPLPRSQLNPYSTRLRGCHGVRKSMMPTRYT